MLVLVTGPPPVLVGLAARLSVGLVAVARVSPVLVLVPTRGAALLLDVDELSAHADSARVPINAMIKIFQRNDRMLLSATEVWGGRD